MALRNVFGTYLRIDGTPCQGCIEFTPTSTVIKRGSAVYLIQTQYAYLDLNGSFNINLTVSDDVTLEPAWQWIVDEKLEGGKIWYMEVPTGAGSLDISTVIPSSPMVLFKSLEDQIFRLDKRLRALEGR